MYTHICIYTSDKKKCKHLLHHITIYWPTSVFTSFKESNVLCKKNMRLFRTLIETFRYYFMDNSMATFIVNYCPKQLHEDPRSKAFRPKIRLRMKNRSLASQEDASDLFGYRCFSVSDCRPPTFAISYNNRTERCRRDAIEMLLHSGSILSSVHPK